MMAMEVKLEPIPISVCNSSDKQLNEQQNTFINMNMDTSRKKKPSKHTKNKSSSKKYELTVKYTTYAKKSKNHRTYKPKSSPRSKKMLPITEFQTKKKLINKLYEPLKYLSGATKSRNLSIEIAQVILNLDIEARVVRTIQFLKLIYGEKIEDVQALLLILKQNQKQSKERQNQQIENLKIEQKIAPLLYNQTQQPIN